MAALQVQVQNRGHDRAGSEGAQHEASQSIEVAAVKAQNRQTLLPEDYEHDGERRIQQSDANHQELCKAALRYVPPVHPHDRTHSEPERD
jgi:hypothetical protein